MNDHDVFADTMMIMQIWLAHTTSETNWACRFNHLNRVDLPTRYRGFSRPSMTDVPTTKTYHRTVNIYVDLPTI